jgi:hypothetical protein
MGQTTAEQAVYKRLPGRGPRRRGLAAIASRCRLYLTSDHLLSVDNHGFSEDYRRFYLSDILAITMCKTSRWLGWNMALAILVTLCLAGALLKGGGGLTVFLFGLGVLFTLLLTVHAAQGPTCLCHIVTAVQREQLPSLCRVKTALKAMAIIEAAIERVQGTIDRATLSAQLGAIPAALEYTHQGPLQKVVKSEREVRHYGGAVHLIAFSMLVFCGLLGALAFVHHTSTASIISTFVGLAYSLFVVAALVKQQGTDIPSLTRKVTWLSLVFLWVSNFMGSVTGFVYAMQYTKGASPIAPPDQWQLFRMMLDLSPTDSLYLTITSLFHVTLSLALGAFGILMIVRHRRSTNVSATSREGGFQS